MKLDALSQSELERIEHAGGTDLVVGLLDAKFAEQRDATLAMARDAVAGLPRIGRAVVVCNNGAHAPQTANLEEPSTTESPVILFCDLSPSNERAGPGNIAHAWRNVFALGEKLDARACTVIASQAQGTTAEWIHRLVRPIVDLGFDLVAPRYTRHRMEGLLNRSILSPLYRALYGEQLQNPLGPDFGLSRKLVQRIPDRDSGVQPGDDTSIVASIASVAACGGFQICESHLGARVQAPIDWMNLSSLLAQILGPVFLDMERQAAAWQRIRGSKPAPGFGAAENVAAETSHSDVQQMIDSFRIGVQNLEEIWGIVLPPTTLLELRKLSRLPPNGFRMPDELWVRIVYDFALGHRLRTINRDHLLRSITPLYLGWIASWALEMDTAGPAQIDAGTERLAATFETSKPYLVSRWRWPDRFNP